MPGFSKLLCFLQRIVTTRSHVYKEGIQYEDNIIRTPDINFSLHPKGLAYYLEKSMRKHHISVAQIDGETDHKETFEEILTKAKRIANRLKKLFNITNKHIVCFHSCNHSNLIPTYLSIILLGAMPASLDANMTILDIEYILSELKPRLIIAEDNMESLFKNLLVKLKLQADIVCFDPNKNMSLMNVVQGNDENLKPYIVENLNETALIIITTGSKAPPKCACINHYTMLYFATEMCFGSTLSFTSLFQYTSIVNMMSCIVHGQPVYICKTFLADKIWAYLQRYKISFMYLTPYQCAILFQCKPDSKFRNLRRIAIGGYSLAPYCLSEYQDQLPHTKIMHVYGLAELFLPFQVADGDATRTVVSVGQPKQGFNYKVIIAQGSRKLLGYMQPGELWIQSVACSKKYVNNLHGLQAYDENGFFNTGDLAYYDKEFNFFITGRACDMITTKDGTLLRVIKFEHAIMQNEEIEYCAVVGIKKGDYEDAVAYVTPLQNSKITVDTLIDFIYEHIPHKYHLAEGVIFCDYLPVTASWKINRMELKKWFAQKKFQ